MITSDFIDLSRRLRSALTPADLDETLANITAAAVEVLPDVQYSSITVRHSDGRLETAAPTHDFLLDLDAAQYDLREGPCYDAATDTVHASAPHLATDTSTPRRRMRSRTWTRWVNCSATTPRWPSTTPARSTS